MAIKITEGADEETLTAGEQALMESWRDAHNTKHGTSLTTVGYMYVRMQELANIQYEREEKARLLALADNPTARAAAIAAGEAV